MEDRLAGDTIDLKFNTKVGGVGFTLAGTPAISVYKDNGTTESTAGVVLTVDIDGRTGCHHIRITTASDGSFYANGSDFVAVITTGTVNGLSAVGLAVGAFSLANRSHLRPTTAGRTLGVDASGRVDLGTWLGVAPNALSSGRVDVIIGAVTAGVIAAASFAANALDAVWSTATRLLTAGTNIVLAKGVGVTGFNDLSAAQVNTEADTALSDVGLTGTVTGRMDVAVSTRLATAGYTAPLDAAGTRTAVGLASANLDTQLAAIAAYVDTEVATLLSRLGVPAGASIAADIAALFTTALTESYNADGVAPTPAQALFVIMQRLTEFAIASTTITAKKLDGVSTAFTLTIDSATDPTSSTRTT